MPPSNGLPPEFNADMLTLLEMGIVYAVRVGGVVCFELTEKGGAEDAIPLDEAIAALYDTDTDD